MVMGDRIPSGTRKCDDTSQDAADSGSGEHEVESAVDREQPAVHIDPAERPHPERPHVDS